MMSLNVLEYVKRHSVYCHEGVQKLGNIHI